MKGRSSKDNVLFYSTFTKLMQKTVDSFHDFILREWMHENLKRWI